MSRIGALVSYNLAGKCAGETQFELMFGTKLTSHSIILQPLAPPCGDHE